MPAIKSFILHSMNCLFIKTISILVTILAAIASYAVAQSSASATASAVIVVPITIGETKSAVLMNQKADIRLSEPMGIRSKVFKTDRSTGYETSLMTAFTVTGEPHYSYVVLLTGSANLQLRQTGVCQHKAVQQDVLKFELHAGLKKDPTQPTGYLPEIPVDVTIVYE